MDMTEMIFREMLYLIAPVLDRNLVQTLDKCIDELDDVEVRDDVG